MTIPDLQFQYDATDWAILAGDVYDYVVVGNYLYTVGDYYDTGYSLLTVWDMSDLANTQNVGFFENTNYYYYNQVKYHNGSLFVTATDYSNGKILVFNLDDPTTPTQVDSIGSSGSPYYTYTIPYIAHSGDYLFSIGWDEYNCPMVVFDISVVDTITKHGDVSRSGGKWAEYPVYFNDHVLIPSSGTDDLFDVSDINSISLVTNNFTTFDHINAIYGDYAWVLMGSAYYNRHAHIYNVSDPTNVTELGQYPVGDDDGMAPPYYLGAYGFNIRDDGRAFGLWSYATTPNSGMSELDITSPLAVTVEDNLGPSIDYYVSNWWDQIIFFGTSNMLIWSRGTGLMIWGIPSGIQVGDTVLLIPNYGDKYDRAAIKGGAISTGDNVQLYPLKGGTKVAIKEEWSAGDKIIF